MNRNRSQFVAMIVLMATTYLAGCNGQGGGHVEGEVEIAPPVGERGTGYVLGLDGNPVKVQYVVENGRAIVGGDMDFGPVEAIARTPDEVTSYGGGSSFDGTAKRGNFRPGASARWPDNGTHIIIPYVVEGTFTSAAWANVQKAIDTIHAQSRVRFVPRSGQVDYVVIYPGNDRCEVGRQGNGRQYCGPSGNYWQVAMHELGHAIGLQHEHQRADRDTHIIVYRERTTNPEEYDILSLTSANWSGAYDFNSIMHYGSMQFANSDKPVMVPNPDMYPGAGNWYLGASCSDPNILIKPLGCRSGFSAADLNAINDMYRAGSTTFSVVSMMNGLCLDARNNQNGTRVWMYNCLGATHSYQRWTYYPESGELKVFGNKCLDAWTAKRLDPVVVHDCHGGGNQKWDVSNPGQIVLRGIKDEYGRSMCVDIAYFNNQPYAEMLLQYCHRGENQAWRRSPTGTGGATGSIKSDQLSSDGKPRCMDAPNANNGTQLWMWYCHPNSDPAYRNQRFTHTPAGELRVHGKCVDGHASQAWDPVKVWDCHGGDNQKWVRDPAGRYVLKSNTALCIDIYGGSTGVGSNAPLILYNCHTGANQKWYYHDIKTP